MLPYGPFGVQLLVLSAPANGEELWSEPVARKPAAEADNEDEDDVFEEMRWVIPAQRDTSAGDNTGYDARSWPRSQAWKTTSFTARKIRQEPNTRT